MTVFQGAPRLANTAESESKPETAKVISEERPLADMTVKELVEICATERIETPSKPKKADLIAAIEAARSE